MYMNEKIENRLNNCCSFLEGKPASFYPEEDEKVPVENYAKDGVPGAV